MFKKVYVYVCIYIYIHIYIFYKHLIAYTEIFAGFSEIRSQHLNTLCIVFIAQYDSRLFSVSIVLMISGCLVHLFLLMFPDYLFFIAPYISQLFSVFIALYCSRVFCVLFKRRYIYIYIYIYKFTFFQFL